VGGWGAERGRVGREERGREGGRRKAQVRWGMRGVQGIKAKEEREKELGGEGKGEGEVVGGGGGGEGREGVIDERGRVGEGRVVVVSR